MNSLIKLKQQVLERFFASPQQKANNLILELLNEGRITVDEFTKLKSGFEKTEIHILVDNHVDVNATHWGNISTGNGQTGDYK